jgi:hypothetical protein
MMAESKFTPGPWEVHGPTEEGNASRRVFAGTTYLGTVTNSDMDHEEIAANAELWVDAPRMLEVLRTLCESTVAHEEDVRVATKAFADAERILEKHGG